MPDTAAGCKLIKSTVTAGQVLLLVKDVGTGAGGNALTVTVTGEALLLHVPLTQAA